LTIEPVFEGQTYDVLHKILANFLAIKSEKFSDTGLSFYILAGMVLAMLSKVSRLRIGGWYWNKMNEVEWSSDRGKLFW
jgi:hypothetical protein